MDAERVDVRRGAERFTTEAEGTTTRHSFSFGAHYDPGNVGFGPLVAHNDERLAPGRGFDAHPHRDVEIVTWVVEGRLVHAEPPGEPVVVPAGWVQRLSAGSGVTHSERNDASPDEPVRFVQMWLRPDDPGRPPSYAVAPAGRGPLVPLASGVAGLDAPVRLAVAGAALLLARPAPEETVTLPDAPRLHVFVARGAVDLEGVGRLADGDAARLTRPGSRTLRALPDPGHAGPAAALAWLLPGP